MHLAQALLREAPRASVSLVVSSHLVRAVQTAELVMASLRTQGVEVVDLLEADPSLAPDSPPSLALARLIKRAERIASSGRADAFMLVVCHEPIIRGIAAGIVQRNTFAPFVTAGCACFQDGVERFAVSPEGRVR